MNSDSVNQELQMLADELRGEVIDVEYEIYLDSILHAYYENQYFGSYGE